MRIGPVLSGAFFLLLNLNQLGASQHCAPAILNLPVDDPQWVRLTVRVPGTPLLDEDYPARAQSSLRNVFAPWFLNSSRNRLAFVEMFRRAHIILAAGEDGRGTYRGASRREQNVATNFSVQPGLYRHEISPHGGSFSFGFRWDDHFGEDLSPHLETLIARYLRALGKDAPAEPTARTVDHMPVASPVHTGGYLPRLGGRILIRNDIYRHYAVHHYPPSRDVPLILEAMDDVMEDLWRLFHDGNRHTHRSRNRMVSLLAEYIYLGANAHAFNGGNFSLVMGHVNFLLSVWDLNGIYHSNLDYLSLVIDFDEVERHFRRHVSAANRGVEIDPAPSAKLRKIPLLAHLPGEGDLIFSGGEILRRATEPNHLEGIELLAESLPPDMTLEYRVHLAGVGDTPWVAAGTYAGRRGESRAIEGIQFRMASRPDLRLAYQCESRGRAGGEISRAGEFCGTRGEFLPLTGFKIWLEPRGGD